MSGVTTSPDAKRKMRPNDRPHSDVAKVSALDEGQQVGVQQIGIDGEHAMRETGIGLQRAVFQQLHRLVSGVGDRNDLVVFTVQNKRRNADILQVLGLVGFREGLEGT